MSTLTATTIATISQNGMKVTAVSLNLMSFFTGSQLLDFLVLVILFAFMVMFATKGRVFGNKHDTIYIIGLIGTFSMLCHFGLFYSTTMYAQMAVFVFCCIGCVFPDKIIELLDRYTSKKINSFTGDGK